MDGHDRKDREAGQVESKKRKPYNILVQLARLESLSYHEYWTRITSALLWRKWYRSRQSRVVESLKSDEETYQLAHLRIFNTAISKSCM